MDPALPPPTGEPSPLALECWGLRKRFASVTAVDGLELRVPRGQFYAFLGPNGAGKTTALRMIAGLLRPDGGGILINGLDLADHPTEAKRPLAYVPDDPVLYGKLRSLEHLEFVAALWQLLPVAEARLRAEELLQTLRLWGKRSDGIESFSRRHAKKMSALASALIHRPSLMLLDEPLTGLDAAAARQVKDLLTDFVRDGGTVVLTTHILEVAERMAERIGIIAAGRLVAEGTLEELRQRAGETGGTLEDIFLRVTRSSDGEASAP